ncbi:TRAP transporter substrate-binding protein [Azospirillum argentinense]|uniref:ABC transporter substrate-binding protein n=1 Tax=Azospirillum argentinense TaxID=2970906 RepID=A0A2K1G1M8_9PROT|nr:TRAP transporter substrate-binding protein [Azospirillum argentinense]PNQ98698.1 ABC transporter substrate-binding protein [Azospirillum argentinense]
MNVDKLPIVLTVAVAALFAAVPATAQTAERTMRLSAAVAQDHPFAAGVSALTACAADKSAGKMKIQSFWNAALGSDMQAVQLVRGGSLDMVVASTSPLASLVPAMGVFDLPFLFENEKEADRILDGAVGQQLSEKLQGVGLVNLAYWENGFRNLTNSRRPIQKWEDLGGTKIRVMQNPVFMDTFSTLGANAVPMAFSELFTALETRAVDGQENPYANIETGKFYEAQKYLSVTNHAYTPAVILYSKKIWDGLSSAERDVLQSCAAVARTEERRVNREQSEKSLARLKDLGMQVNELSAEERKRMLQKVAPVYEKHAAAIGAETMTLLQSELAQLRKANP